MKLIRVHIVSARSCGGLLDGLDVRFRGSASAVGAVFEPVCLIGPNGAGKSQFIQVVAEAFQSLFHAVAPNEERDECNADLQFEVEYLIYSGERFSPTHVKATRLAKGNRRPAVKIERRSEDEWLDCPLDAPDIVSLLPAKVIGYTSGANETLSLPFLVSRAG